ncbi:MAG: hypothetical protein Q4G45_09880 [Actinomycetia bacterium]|nr:hypothetical protein [Actinomycetes bacterium]
MKVLADEVAAQSKVPDDPDYWIKALLPGYRVTLAVGTFVLIVVTIKNLVMLAGSRSPAERHDLLHSLTGRVVLYPVMAVAAPAVVATLVRLGDELVAAATTASGSGLSELMTSLGGKFFGFAASSATTLGLPGFLVLVAAVLLIVTLIAWLVQAWVAPMAMLILTLMVPVVLALSAQPRHRERLLRLMGGLLGAMLTPFITRFVFWATMPLISAELDQSAEATLGLFKVVVLLGVCTSSPLVLSHVMPHLVPGAGGVQGGPGPVSMLAQGAQAGLDSAQQLVRQAARGSQTAVGTPAASARAASLGQGAAAKGASAGAGAAGAALGAAAAVVTAGVIVGQGIVNAGRSAASQSLAASGGGQSSDTAAPVHLPQPRGSGSARPATKGSPPQGKGGPAQGGPGGPKGGPAQGQGGPAGGGAGSAAAAAAAAAQATAETVRAGGEAVAEGAAAAAGGPETVPASGGARPGAAPPPEPRTAPAPSTSPAPPVEPQPGEQRPPLVPPETAARDKPTRPSGSSGSSGSEGAS